MIEKNSMKGPLDDIEKKNFFEAPEGYFEDLPMRIQKRVEPPTSRPSYIGVLRYALPVILIGIAIYIFIPGQEQSVQEPLLSEISQEEALDYLSESGITAMDIIPVVYAGTEIDDLIKPPTLEEEYILNEELLFTPEWSIEEDLLEIEDI